MSNVLAVIQARVNSSRLPRKSLATIAGRASVEHVAIRAHAVAPVVVVVPAGDAPAFRSALPPEIDVLGVDGDENDVLARFAAAGGGHDVIVRLTADCPFVDPEGIRAVAEAVEQGADYATLAGIPNGFDAEAFSADILISAHRLATDPHDREHVTPWIARIATNQVRIDRGLPRWRLTLDTAEDLTHLRAVAAEIDCTPPHPTVEELLALFDRRPDLVRMDDA